MAGSKSKTNVTGRETPKDPRPKSELIIEAIRKPNGAIGLRKRWNPINREARS